MARREPSARRSSRGLVGQGVGRDGVVGVGVSFNSRQFWPVSGDVSRHTGAMGIWILIMLAVGGTVIGLVWLLHRDRGLDRASRLELRQLRRTDGIDERMRASSPDRYMGGFDGGPSM